MIEDMIQDELAQLERIQPYIASMGMSVGFVWNQWSTEARAAIMDMVDGSTGLHEKIVEWATEFDEAWHERLRIHPDESDFTDQIVHFTDAKIKALLVEARLTQ